MRIMEGVGHFPHLEAPREVRAALAELFASEISPDRF